MADDILPVDTGVAAFVTLVGLAAHMVEHVLLRETDGAGGLASPPSSSPHPTRSLGLSVDSDLLPG